MHDWNVVVTVREGGYNRSRKLLACFGEVERTDFYNILVMRMADPLILLEELREESVRDPGGAADLARVMPVVRAFTFQTLQEFKVKARESVTPWLEVLAGKSFHLRMHRRGFKGKLSGMEEEHFLDKYLLAGLENAGTPGRLAFTDPDAIIAMETIGPRAGLSLWSREELARFPLLHLD